MDDFRSVLGFLSPCSVLPFSSKGKLWVLRFMDFDVFVGLIEARIPVGRGILDLVGGGNVRRERD